MALYLRDQQISSITIDVEAIREIIGVFEERYSQLENGSQAPDDESPFFHFVIRFDNKGYRVFGAEELLVHFQQAKEVERLIFTVESRRAFASNRQFGAFVELRLDAKDPSSCSLVSTSDKKDWAEASFSAVHETLLKHKNRHWLTRSPWANLAIQLIGVILMFMLSLWAAYKISPRLDVQSPFVMSFLFILLVLSNVWTYLNPALIAALTRIFPNIEFIRPEKARMHWLLQVIVGSSVFGVVVYILGSTFGFLFSVVGDLVK